MKRIILFLLVASTLASCVGGNRGELVGVAPREDWIQYNPYGMNYILGVMSWDLMIKMFLTLR
jgi:hypothetical protein